MPTRGEISAFFLFLSQNQQSAPFAWEIWPTAARNPSDIGGLAPDETADWCDLALICAILLSAWRPISAYRQAVPPPLQWYYWKTAPMPGALNMAWDEVRLQSAARLGAPLLRFYAWSEPAATFGRSQKFLDVSRLTAIRPLIRRPTGGGLVPHLNDWTYSLAIPPDAPWRQIRAQASYFRLHQWLQAAFQKIGLDTELASQPKRIGDSLRPARSPNPAVPGRCFAGAEANDLVFAGKKLAGAAQRRARSGLLIQGSIQPPPLSIARAEWENALRTVATETWHVQWRPLQAPSVALRQQAEKLAANKYAVPEYARLR